MSDNVPITPGTGAVIATDDVAGVHYQVVKLNVGGDGESKPLGPTNRMPVELPTGVTLTVSLDATALAALIAAATPTTQAVSLNAAAMTALANAATPAGLATTAGQSAIITALGGLLQAGGTVALDATALAALESITVQQSALPTGASTEATLAALNAKFASLGIKLAASSLSVAPASDALFRMVRVSKEVTNKSVVVATAGTAVKAADANPLREGFSIQAPANADVWFNTLAGAVLDSPSIKILAGALYETPPGGAGLGELSVNSSVSGAKVTVREY